MYCSYISTVTATQAQVLDDIIKLYTGQITDKNNLSASCDKTNTELVTTVAAGWTVHDAAAGTNAQVIKAPVADNASQFKFVWISTNVNTYVEFRIYETWNATTHTGTNPVSTAATTTGQRLSYTQSCTLYMCSTSRYCILFSKNGATLGNSFNSTASYCIEHTRWSPWDTVAAGYLPCIGNLSTGSAVSMAWPRFKGSAGTDLLASGTNAGAFTSPVGLSLSKVINDTGQQVIPRISVSVHAAALGQFGGSISELSNIYITAQSLGAIGDEMTIQSTVYIYFPTVSITPSQVLGAFIVAKA